MAESNPDLLFSGNDTFADPAINAIDSDSNKTIAEGKCQIFY